MNIEPFLMLRGKEEKARDFYKQCLEGVKDYELRNLFSFLVSQEEGHMRVVEELVELLSTP